MPIDVPTPGSPILDTWGAAVAGRLNQLIPLILSSDFSTNSTSLVDVFTFPVISGRRYNFQLVCVVTVAHASSQCQWGLDRPSGDSVAWCRACTTGVTTEELQRIGSTGTATTFGNAGSTGSQRQALYTGRYSASADGTFRIQVARSGSSGGVTVLAGSGGMVVESV